jgi:hypothetical protein
MKAHTITSRLVKFGVLFALALVASTSVPSSFAGPAHAQRACHRVTIKATIMCQFNYAVMGWEGRAIVSINGGEAKTATLETTGTPPEFKEDGAPYGYEVNKFIFDDGSGSFVVSGAWESSWTGTPGLLEYRSVGKVDQGLGDYEGISGWVVTAGPFLTPMPPTPGVIPLYIGEMFGLVRDPAG